MPPERLSRPGAAKFAEESLCRAEPNLKGGNQAGIRAEFDHSARAGKTVYINDLVWLGAADSNLDTQREFPLSHPIRTTWTWCANGSEVPPAD
jgi:hypothetical protein